MSDTPNQNFKIVAAITGYTLRKSADGTEKYVLSGMASNTNIDLTGERMADSALKAMAKSLETSSVTINNEHGNDWDDDFGEVTKLWVTDAHELMMEAELDPDHYRTKTLIKALDKGKKLGLSIGGVVKEAAMEWFADLGRKVMTYKDIALFHVAITGTPAVADTWVSPITKSVKDWKETPMPQEETPVVKTEERTPEEVEATPVVTPEEAPADEPNESAPAEDEKSDAPEEESTPVEPEAPAQEEEAEELATPEADPAPEPADDDTSEVAKSAVFGDWAEISLTSSAIDNLAWALQDHVWMVLIDNDKSPQDKIAAIDAGLQDFRTLILKVVTALVDGGNAEEIQRAAESFKANKPETVAKSLAEKDTKVAELTKSLSEKDAELETTKKSLAEVTTKLETIEARKSLAFQSGARAAVQVDEETTKSANTEPSIGELYLQKIGALPEAA
jgi:phage head maturation protease